MKEFAEVLKILLDKHIVHSIVAIVIGITAYAITPVDNLLLVKIGKELYMVLMGGIAFILITFIQFLINSIAKWIGESRDRKEIEEYRYREELETVQEWWDFFDGISEDEKNIIYSLLEN